MSIKSQKNSILIKSQRTWVTAKGAIVMTYLRSLSPKELKTPEGKAAEKWMKEHNIPLDVREPDDEGWVKDQIAFGRPYWENRADKLRNQSKLSPTQTKIVRLLSEGKTPKEVQKILGMTPTEYKLQKAKMKKKHEKLEKYIEIESNLENELTDDQVGQALREIYENNEV